MAALNTETSVLAKTRDGEDYLEGRANESLSPGEGVVRVSDGFDTVPADSISTRVVREQRNPASRGIEDNESPLDKDYSVGDNVETIGFQSHDQARCLFAYSDLDDDDTDDTYSEGDPVGWNSTGHLEHTGADGSSVTVDVARIAEEDDFTMSNGDDPVHVLVEFL